jgi:hypothetical protein
VQYVMIAEHAPEFCPTSNAKIRSIMKEGAKGIPELAKSLGLQIITLNVFGPDHIVLAVIESPNIDMVRDFTMQSGLIQWNKIKIHATWTMEEALARGDKLEPIF